MATSAELIFRGGPIVTLDDTLPAAEAVAVAEGKILAVGSEEEVMQLVNGQTTIRDLRGKSLLPAFIDSHGHFMIAHRQMCQWNSAIEKGLICSNHSDFSVTPVDPMRTMWSAVTRQSRGGKVIGQDRLNSLKALTINAAIQLHEEDQKGSIETGKLADLVILDANPLTVEVDDILRIRAVEIFKEGKCVFKMQ